MKPRKTYAPMEGGREAPPTPPEPPRCEKHDRPGRYAFGTLVVCDFCDAGYPAKAAAEEKFDFSDEEITADSTMPWWFGGKLVNP